MNNSTFQRNDTEQVTLYANMALIQQDLGKLLDAEEWMKKERSYAGILNRKEEREQACQL